MKRDGEMSECEERKILRRQRLIIGGRKESGGRLSVCGGEVGKRCILYLRTGGA